MAAATSAEPGDGNRGKDPRLLSPISVLLLAVLGFGLGFAVLLIDANDTQRSRAFIHSAGFLVWGTLIGVQAAYWLIVAGPLYAGLRRFSPEWNRFRGQTVAIGVLSAVVLAVGPVMTRILADSPDWPLAWHSAKIIGLSLVAVLAIGAPALCGIALVRFRVLGIDASTLRPAVQTLLSSRGEARRFLGIAGGLVGLATLATGALQRAVVPAFLPADTVPDENILIYGGFLTAVLAITYVPTHLAVTVKAEEIRDTALKPHRDDLNAWIAERTSMEEALRMGEGPSQTLQSALFIVSPLLASVFSLLIPKS